MAIKKGGVFFFILLLILTMLIFCSLLSAELDVKAKTISSHAIIDLNLPAVFELEIKNLGKADTFSIYSIAGIDIKPNETFSLAEDETKKIKIEAYPTFPLKVSPDYYSFEYKIKGENSGLTVDDLVISAAYLKDSFNIHIENINLDSTKAVIRFQNKYGGNLDNLNVQFSSDFFSEAKQFSMSANEEKVFELPINEKVLKQSLAGPYIVNVEVSKEEISGTTTAALKFEEQPGIETTEAKEGFLFKRQEIEKTNKGNLRTTVEIYEKRNLFSGLFTSTSVKPSNTEINGFQKSYLFQKELLPGESLKVIITTNWLILAGIILVVIILGYVIDEYIRNKIKILKTVSPVRTKGGEFALKIQIKIKARDFVERLRIIDRLPPMVKVYEKYGIPPEKVDEKNRRLEWSISSLAKKEERTFSYIVYSKVGVFGKFELPSTEVLYEFKGRPKEASSNNSFYFNEPSK